MKINGVEFEMKTDAFEKYHFEPGRQMGLLAQNVETVVPEAVNEKDGYKGVDGLCKIGTFTDRSN